MQVLLGAQRRVCVCVCVFIVLKEAPFHVDPAQRHAFAFPDGSVSVSRGPTTFLRAQLARSHVKFNLISTWVGVDRATHFPLWPPAPPAMPAARAGLQSTFARV